MATRSPFRDPRSLWFDPADVRPAAEPRSPQPPEPPSPPRRPGPSRRRRVAVLAAIAAALGGAGLAGAQLGGDDAVPGRAAAPAAGPPADSGRAAGETLTNRIYAQAGGSVVSVQVEGGSGTGFLLEEEGTVVTNAHVVGQSSVARVRFEDDGDPVEARVLGTDPSSDLAVLKVDPAAAAGAEPLTLADSADVAVGDEVVAIGYPLGLDRTATAGIVSGLGREIQAPDGFTIDEVIQTDAPINPGNSGGPLLDAKGRVIGVNSQIATAGGGGGNVGIGFAVPSNTVREIVPQLKAGRTVERAFLGVSTAPAPGGGTQVAAVTDGSPAASAGLRQGDVLVAVDGEAVDGPDAVASVIAGRSPGDTVELEVRRGGTTETLTAELATRPGQARP